MKRYVPKYLQLLENLKKEISIRKVGDRFYTQVGIMQKYGLSCATVSRAVDELVENGMLCRIRGKGTFISSTVPVPQRVSEDYPDLALCFCSKIRLMMDTNSPNWFLYAQIQQGVINSYRGRSSIYNEEDLLAALQAKSINKVILVNPDKNVVETLQNCRVPYVILSQDQCHWDTNTLQINHMTGVIEAMTYLNRELGHTRIALITTENKPHSDRIAAYKISEHTLGLENISSYTCFCEHGTREYSKTAVMKLMSLPQPPTAILVDTDLKAFGVLEYLAEQNIAVPETVSLIGFDNRDECSFTTPPLTSIDCSFINIGKMAVEMLEDLVKSQKTVIPNRTFMTSLVVRKSCAPIKQ